MSFLESIWYDLLKAVKGITEQPLNSTIIPFASGTITLDQQLRESIIIKNVRVDGNLKTGESIKFSFFNTKTKTWDHRNIQPMDSQIFDFPINRFQFTSSFSQIRYGYISMVYSGTQFDIGSIGVTGKPTKVIDYIDLINLINTINTINHIDEITYIDYIATLNSINNIANIVNIQSLDLIDLITTIQTINTVQTINTIGEIQKITSIDAKVSDFKRSAGEMTDNSNNTIWTPATGKKIRLKMILMTLKDLSGLENICHFRWTTTGDYHIGVSLDPNVRQTFAINLVGCNIEGGVNEALVLWAYKHVSINVIVFGEEI